MGKVIINFFGALNFLFLISAVLVLYIGEAVTLLQKTLLLTPSTNYSQVISYNCTNVNETSVWLTEITFHTCAAKLQLIPLSHNLHLIIKLTTFRVFKDNKKMNVLSQTFSPH